MFLSGRDLRSRYFLPLESVGAAAPQDKVRLFRFSVNLDVVPDAAAMSIQPVHWARANYAW